MAVSKRPGMTLGFGFKEIGVNSFPFFPPCLDLTNRNGDNQESNVTEHACEIEDRVQGWRVGFQYWADKMEENRFGALGRRQLIW